MVMLIDIIHHSMIQEEMSLYLTDIALYVHPSIIHTDYPRHGRMEAGCLSQRSWGWGTFWVGAGVGVDSSQGTITHIHTVDMPIILQCMSLD